MGKKINIKPGGGIYPSYNATLIMATNFISIRVLQHDNGDQIRIGSERYIYEDQLDKAVQDTIAQYEKNRNGAEVFRLLVKSTISV